MRPRVHATGFARLLGELQLLFLGIFFILLVVALNKDWFARVCSYWDDFLEQQNEPGTEARKIARYGNAYTISLSIEQYLEKNGEKDKAIVLVPPAAYFTAHQINYPVPEPAVFYYYTSLKTVRTNTKDPSVINWVVLVENGSLVLKKIETAAQRAAILASLSQFKNTL